MKRSNVNHVISFLLLAVLLSSCAAIGSIFKAGVWVGVIAIVIVILIIFWIIGKARK
jgi:hypothetical protein